MTLNDYSEEEIEYLVELAVKLKKMKRQKKYKYFLKNKNIALIFEKTSTRTRCAASVACYDEGAHAEFLGRDDIQMGKKESVKDTARVLGRMYDGILFRGFSQDTAKMLSDYSGVPVINGLTDSYHPTQVLADLMTIKERFGRLSGLKIAYLGDGRNNMANSLLTACPRMGMDFSIGAPIPLQPEKGVVDLAEKLKKSGTTITITDDPAAAVKGADIIYTDVWVSMGEEGKSGIDERVKMLAGYEVNEKIIKSTGKSETIFLHCLPASHKDGKHYGEVTEDVFESENSLVFDQAENRMHTIKAIFVALIGE